jgi:hypothetical protein
MQTELGLSTLHKTLKDPTRQKIILALSERASLSYTDLMTTLQIDSTGKLNYHLKILNGLISKDADGRYFLTAKGKTAAQLLRQFPDVDKRRLQFWIVAGLAQAAFLISVIALYYFNYTSFAAMVQGLIVGTFTMVLTYLLYKAQGVQLVHGSSTEHHAIQVAYITGGACIAGLIVFLGGAFLLGEVPRLLSRPPLLTGVWASWFLVIAFIIAPTIGGATGYLRGKKRGFQKIDYGPSIGNV